MPRRALAGLALLAGALGATGARGPQPVTGASGLAPATVLARYRSALATLPHSKTISFEYAVSQLGLHTMEQTHRVYRSGRSERDETLWLDGYELKQSAVRIFKNRTDRYDIATVAPKAGAYDFTFTEAVGEKNAVKYVFATARRAAGAFAVREIEIDGRTFLPAIVRFGVASAGARGAGVLAYGRADRYWVIREARVDVRLKDGTHARERIVWTKYRFSSSLPRSTFDSPRPRATGLPLEPDVLPAEPGSDGQAPAPEP